MERVVVYIDGSNFYKYLKRPGLGFPKGSWFDYTRFVDFLVRGRKLVSKRYYVGIARDIDGTEKSKAIVRGQQKFLAGLKNDGFVIKPGRIMYDGGEIREKGTDVKIAVDLVVGAADDLYDVAVIISSDTDLIPALDYIRYRKKKIEYVGFSHAPSFGMKKEAHHSLLLLPDQLTQFKNV